MGDAGVIGELKLLKLTDVPMDHPEVKKVIALLTGFKNDFKLEFNPKVSLDNCFRKIAKWDRVCLCSSDRKCPCGLALDEISKTGYCHCKLFMSRKKFEELGYHKKG